jgi:transcriptional regulator with PAS, ATPase and Fis domain
MISNDFDPKNPNGFACNLCHFLSCNKKDYNRHIETKKHIFNVSQCFSIEKTQKNPYECHCGKTYKDNSGLWRHKKKCIFEDNEIEEKSQSNEIQELKEIMKYLMKENSEMKNMMMAQHTSTQNMMMDVIKTGTHNTTNNTNSHNKAFNLNFFLNETCKDAMNITDFVSSIKVSLDDLENTGRQGYVEGISNIILQKLKNLNHYDRPIHCADQKREVLYIKNDNQWIKEGEEKPLLTKAIKTIANENIKQIKTWRDKNPECTDSDSRKNNLYLKIVSNSMNGSTETESDKNIDKIISNVAKETIIPKEL